jgi:hypothetical protein
MVQTTYPLARTVTALSLETVLADIKEGIRKIRKSCHGVYNYSMRRNHIESHLFLICTKNGSVPKIFGYQVLQLLDCYRPGL